MDTGLAKVGDWVGTGRLIIDLFSDKPIYSKTSGDIALCQYVHTCTFVYKDQACTQIDRNAKFLLTLQCKNLIQPLIRPVSSDFGASA